MVDSMMNDLLSRVQRLCAGALNGGKGGRTSPCGKKVLMSNLNGNTFG